MVTLLLFGILLHSVHARDLLFGLNEFEGSPLFRQIDSDSNGFISKVEFQEFMSTQQNSNQEYDIMGEDADGDGQIGPIEFQNIEESEEKGIFGFLLLAHVASGGKVNTDDITLEDVASMTPLGKAIVTLTKVANGETVEVIDFLPPGPIELAADLADDGNVNLADHFIGLKIFSDDVHLNLSATDGNLDINVLGTSRFDDTLVLQGDFLVGKDGFSAAGFAGARFTVGWCGDNNGTCIQEAADTFTDNVPDALLKIVAVKLGILDVTDVAATMLQNAMDEAMTQLEDLIGGLTGIDVEFFFKVVVEIGSGFDVTAVWTKKVEVEIADETFHFRAAGVGLSLPVGPLKVGAGIMGGWLDTDKSTNFRGYDTAMYFKVNIGSGLATFYLELVLAYNMPSGIMDDLAARFLGTYETEKSVQTGSRSHRVKFVTTSNTHSTSPGPFTLLGYGPLPSSCYSVIGCEVSVRGPIFELTAGTYDGWQYNLFIDEALVANNLWSQNDNGEEELVRTYNIVDLDIHTVQFLTTEAEWSTSAGPFTLLEYGTLPSSCHSATGCEVSVRGPIFELTAETSDGWQYDLIIDGTHMGDNLWSQNDNGEEELVRTYNINTWYPDWVVFDVPYDGHGYSTTRDGGQPGSYYGAGRLDSETAWQPIFGHTSKIRDASFVLDLTVRRKIYGVATKGGGQAFPNLWAVSFYVFTSDDAIHYKQMLSFDGEINFLANNDADTLNYAIFQEPVRARFVMISPRTGRPKQYGPGLVNHIAMRAGVVLEMGACSETMSGKGFDYRGCMRKTKSGRTCQAWDAQEPHVHAYTPENRPNSVQGNYCRNWEQNGMNTIFCYTTDPNKRFEECDLDSLDKSHSIKFVTTSNTHSTSAGPFTLLGHPGALPSSCHSATGCEVSVRGPIFELTAETHDGWQYDLFIDEALVANNLWSQNDNGEEELERTYNIVDLGIHTVQFLTTEAEDANSSGEFTLLEYGTLPPSCHSVLGQGCIVAIKGTHFQLRAETWDGWQYDLFIDGVLIANDLWSQNDGSPNELVRTYNFNGLVGLWT